MGARLRPWLLLSTVAGVVAAAGNVVGLAAAERTYGEQYPSLVRQGIAQDVVNVAVVLPLLVATVAVAWRGGLRAHLLWLGVLLFTVYNYVIYAFSVHFGPLFLVWVAVLGLATYALLGGALALDLRTVPAPRAAGVVRTTGWLLVVVGAAFAALWLSDIARALRAGAAPASATDIGAPTNAVHVLDLALLLPAVVAAGVLLLRRRPAGVAAAPPMLLFLVLTGIPILVTPFVALARDETPVWTVVAPIGAIVILAGAVLAWFLVAMRPRAVEGGGGA